jgi:hypothetical protein
MYVLKLLVFLCASRIHHYFCATHSHPLLAASVERVRAKYPFDATSDKQLSLKVGDVVTVVEKNASGWYKGECNGDVGLFPSNYTERLL